MRKKRTSLADLDAASPLVAPGQLQPVPSFTGKFSDEAADEELAAAAKAKAEAEATRDYVLEHFPRLRGVAIPFEISKIQNLPSHNCLIVDDLILLSYREAEQIIKELPINE